VYILPYVFIETEILVKKNRLLEILQLEIQIFTSSIASLCIAKDRESEASTPKCPKIKIRVRAPTPSPSF